MRIEINEDHKRWFAHLCETMNRLSGENPLEDSRRHAVVVGRVFITRILELAGWTEEETAAAFSRKRSAVNHYRKMFWDLMELPGYDAERDLWNRFKKAI